MKKNVMPRPSNLGSNMIPHGSSGILRDNVILNDENSDIKNNRLELLKMFCNTFNNFINFSKLEGI